MSTSPTTTPNPTVSPLEFPDNVPDSYTTRDSSDNLQRWTLNRAKLDKLKVMSMEIRPELIMCMKLVEDETKTQRRRRVVRELKAIRGMLEGTGSWIPPSPQAARKRKLWEVAEEEEQQQSNFFDPNGGVGTETSLETSQQSGSLALRPLKKIATRQSLREYERTTSLALRLRQKENGGAGVDDSNVEMEDA